MPSSVGPSSWLQSATDMLNEQAVKPLIDSAEEARQRVLQAVPAMPSFASGIPSLNALTGPSQDQTQPQQPDQSQQQQPSLGARLASAIPALSTLTGGTSLDTQASSTADASPPSVSAPPASAPAGSAALPAGAQPSGAATATPSALPTGQAPASSPAPDNTNVSLPDHLDTSSRDANLAQWAPALQAVQAKTGLRADALAAIIQAENGGGQSPLSADSNNYFSISAVDSPYQIGADDATPGYGLPGRFGRYKTPQASLDHFIDLVSTSPRYAEAWANRADPQKFFEGLVKGGYIVPEPGFPVDTWLQNLDAGRQHYNEIAPQAAQTTPAPSGAATAQPSAMPSTASQPAPTQDVDQAALDDPDKWVLCGPVAAVIAAGRRGAAWTVAQAKQISQAANLWDASQGMHGLQSEVDLLNKMNIPAKTGSADAQTLISEAQSGNTPIVSTNNHYFVLTGYDPATGTFDTTTTGGVYKAGARRMTLDQIAQVGGGIQGAAYFDNPSSPTPSVVAGQSQPIAQAQNTGGPPWDLASAGDTPTTATTTRVGTTPGSPEALVVSPSTTEPPGSLMLRQPLNQPTSGPDSNPSWQDSQTEPADTSTSPSTMAATTPTPPTDASSGGMDASAPSGPGPASPGAGAFQDDQTDSGYQQPDAPMSQQIPNEDSTSQPAAPIQQASPDSASTNFGQRFNPLEGQQPEPKPTALPTYGQQVIGNITGTLRSAGEAGGILADQIEAATHGGTIDPQAILNAVNALPYDIYSRARREAIPDVEAVRTQGTDPLFPLRGTGLPLPSPEEVNPEGRPAGDVLAGAGLQAASPGQEFQAPIQSAGFHLAGEGLGLLGRGLDVAAPAIGRGIQAVRGIGDELSAGADRAAALDASRIGQDAAPAYGVFGPVPSPSGGGSQRPTLEMLQSARDKAWAKVQELRDAGDLDSARTVMDRVWELENALSDAKNARLSLEPAIRSDIGRPIGTMMAPEETADDLAQAMRPQERVSPDQAADLSGPVGVPVSRYDRANATAGPVPGARLVTDVGNAALGSVIGATGGYGMPADTEEERRQHGLEGALVGGLTFPIGGRVLGRLGAGRAEGALASLGPLPPERRLAFEAEQARLRSEAALPSQETSAAQPRLLEDDPLRAGSVPTGTSSLLPTRDFGSTAEVIDHVLQQEQEQARVLSIRGASKPGVPDGQAALPEMNESPGLLQRVRDAVAPWERRLNIVRYAGMLSDSATQAMNVGGNAVMQGLDVAATPIAAALDAGRATVTGTPRQVFFSEVPARLAGMRAGASIGLQNAAEILRTGLHPADAAKQMDRSSAGFGTDIPGVAPAGGKVAGAVDFAFEGPLRALAAADSVFRTMAQGGHLAAEGTAAAMKANGGAAVTANVLREAMKDPSIIEKADKLAARSVLQEDRDVTNWYRNVISSAPPGVGAAISTEIPFARTPYNVVAQGVGLTPLGLAGVVQDMAQGKPARDIEYRVARVALGTAVMAGATADYAAGNLTGPRPTDPKELSTLPPGWQPWSRKVQVGGETYYVPLAVLGPLALPPVMAILAGESLKQGKGALSPEWAGKVALGVGQYAAQNTFFQGLSNIGGLFDQRDAGRNIERNVQQAVAQFSPHVIGGGALGREIQRVMGMPNRDPQSVMEALLATHPATAGLVQPRQDVLGRPSVPNASGPIAALARVGREQDVAVLRAYRKAGEGLPLAPPKQVADPMTKEQRPLSVPQQKRWGRVFGQALREGWNNNGNPQDLKTLQGVESDAREVANQTVLGLR